MKKYKGFTLVEMMVALVLGLFVVAGAVQLFSVTKRNFDELESVSIRQQDIMFLSDVISFDVRTAFELSVYDEGQLANGELLSCSGNSAVNEASASIGVEVEDVVAESALSLVYQGLRDSDSSYCRSVDYPNLSEVRYFSFLVNGEGYVGSCFVCEDSEQSLGGGSSLADDIFGSNFRLGFEGTTGGVSVEIIYPDGASYSFQSTIRDKVIAVIQQIND